MLDRRQFLARSSNLAGAVATLAAWQPSPAAADRRGSVHLAGFRFDVSPPLGHALCGGWIKPVVAYDDPLEAIGLVLLGADKPIVICAVDWTGLLNSAHLAWREALADAAGTTADRVAVQCIHQHNAPFACLDAQQIVSAYPELPPIVDVDFFQRCLDRARRAVKSALARAQPVTHVAAGQERVERVAANRRFVGPDGKISDWRGSSSRNPRHKELPEGLIDPWLKTVAFFNGRDKLAACHYYATHPMSYYGDGRVSSEFVGLARKRRQQQDPDCTHIYFTGCAGNVAAGKYNDGSPEARVALTERMYAALIASERELEPRPVEHVSWQTHEVLPPPNEAFDSQRLEREIADGANKVVARNRPAYTLAWLRRCAAGKQPIVLSALHVDNTTLLHMPGESFVEYQLRAQEAAGGRFVATAAYGDGGPWYIPTAEAYPQGGYEVSVAFCGPAVDGLLTDGMRQLTG